MSAEREELIFIKSYLSHQDQDADHGFMVRRIDAVLAGKDPSPDVTAAVAEMHGAAEMPSVDLEWESKMLHASANDVDRLAAGDMDAALGRKVAGAIRAVADRLATAHSSGEADGDAPYIEAHEHYRRQMTKKWPEEHEPTWDEFCEDERMAWRAGFEAYVKAGGT